MEVKLPAFLRLSDIYYPRLMPRSTLTLTVPYSTASYTITLPSSNSVGTLTNDGDGVLTWSDEPTFENITINTGGGTDGLMIKEGSLNTQVNILPPTTLAAAKPDYSLVLPSDDGTPSQFLQTDGSGNLTWASSGGVSGEFDSALFRVFDTTDNTKKIDLDVSAITTATTRTLTLGDLDIELDQSLATSDSVEFVNVVSSGYFEGDTINEHSAATGVTIDGVLLKDGEITLASGVNTVLFDVPALTGDRTITIPDDDVDLSGATTIPTTTTGRWEDLRVPVTSTTKGGAQDPDFIKFRDNGSGSQGVYSYAFDKNTEEELFFNVQFPHSFKLGSTIEPHVHISINVAADEADEAGCVFGLEYTWVDINGTFSTTSIITGTCQFWDAGAATPIYKHYFLPLTNVDGSAITGVSSMMICRLFRNTGNEADTFPQDVFVFEFDIHYQSDTVGSETSTSK